MFNIEVHTLKAMLPLQIDILANFCVFMCKTFLNNMVCLEFFWLKTGVILERV